MIYRTVLRSAFAVTVMLLLSATAQAGVFRAYISSTGNDANPCTLSAPCRLLPVALAAVNDGGEIWMLDSANYNTATVTIAKSVSILAIPGAVGSVLAISGPAISITAPSLTISLRNLVIVPLTGGGGVDGVSMTGASTLTIENCLIANLMNSGVYVVGTGKVEIVNTIIRNNGVFAVYILNGASADISSTKMLKNGYGGVFAGSYAATTTTATVSDSVVSGGISGVASYTNNAGGIARIFLTRSTIQNTTNALDSTSTTGITVIAVSSSMIANNNYAWYQSGTGSVIRTLGNNHIADNTFSIGVLTSVAPL